MVILLAFVAVLSLLAGVISIAIMVNMPASGTPIGMLSAVILCSLPFLVCVVATGSIGIIVAIEQSRSVLLAELRRANELATVAAQRAMHERAATR